MLREDTNEVFLRKGSVFQKGRNWLEGDQRMMGEINILSVFRF